MAKPKIVCIIQARFGSSRLPGKVLSHFKNKPMVTHTIERLKKCLNIDLIVLATTTTAQDKVLVRLAAAERVESFQGSEDDVLDRFFQAAKKYQADIVVRCTGDCPVIDPSVTDHIIDEHLKNGNDYTSNTVVRTFPRGLDTEVINFNTLERVAREAQKPFEREHVTPFIYQHPEQFSIGQVKAEPAQHQPDLRLTVDTLEDYELMTKIFEQLYDQNPFFSIDDILNFLKQQPELSKINRHVQQKAL